MLKLIHSFSAAFQGIKTTLLTERNFRIHTFFFCIVLGMGLYFPILRQEWLVIFVISALVFSLELLNTSIERLCDFVEPHQNEKVKIIKDVAAASVLVASIFAVVIAIGIFWKYIFS